jgi:hypothetical protein
MSEPTSTSTSIMDLPTDPANGGNMSNNINLNASEQMSHANSNSQNNASSISLDQTTINQIVN